MYKEKTSNRCAFCLKNGVHPLAGNPGQDLVELVNAAADGGQDALLEPPKVQLEDAHRHRVRDVLGLGQLGLEVGQQLAIDGHIRLGGQMLLQVECFVPLEIPLSLLQVTYIQIRSGFSVS